MVEHPGSHKDIYPNSDSKSLYPQVETSPLDHDPPLTPKESIGTSGDSGVNVGTDGMASELKKLQDQLDAVRKEAFEEGFQAGLQSAIESLMRHKRESAQGEGDSSRNRAKDKDTPALRLTRGDNANLPRGLGRKYVTDFWRDVTPSEVLSITDVRRAIYEKMGIKISFQTVDRAMEKLAENDIIEKIEDTEGWRLKPKLRSVR